MTTYLLDSVILIDRLNKIKPAAQFIEQYYEYIQLSVVTRSEVLAGCDDNGFVDVQEMLNMFPTNEITVEIADLAAKLRREFNWKLPDAYQAAIAKYNGWTLVTRNTKDFPTEKYEFVKTPYQI